MNEAKEVRLVFNPGKHGTVGLHAVITMSGDRAGALPQPTRRGYTFLGWYTVPDGAAGDVLFPSGRAGNFPPPCGLTSAGGGAAGRAHPSFRPISMRTSCRSGSVLE